MTLYDVHKTSKGVVIGGVNPEFDAMQPNEIQEMIEVSIGIEIHNPDGSVLRSAVAGVEIMTSLIDKKNIFILLQSGITEETIQQEAVVYSKD